jgi:ariadne-1
MLGMQSLPDEYFKKYTKWLIKSYTEDSKTIKWCPNENCDYFVEFSDMLAVDIKCMCGCSYCFKCNIESHKPTNCEWKYNWDQKNKGESEDINWIKANTKPCPNCKKYIEKNQGCNHMTCRECHHEFCWICFDPWKTHGSSYYNCIKFKDNKPQEGFAKELEDKSSMAKTELAKYIFYFDRYSEQHKAFLLAKKQKIQCASFCTQFCEKFKFPLSELEFLSIAFDVIIESRRILENTYIEMFYIANAQEKEMIEFLLERLQFFCDQLHEKVEQKKEEFLLEVENHNKFYLYKNEVTGKMSLVKNAFDCFAKGMENGFSNVKS